MGEYNNEKSALVPRLRFPDFQDAWASSPMSELYSFKGNNSLSRDKLNYNSGSFRNIHYGDIHTKFALHFRVDAEPVPYINDGETYSTIRPENYCMAGDMVFADASEDTADIGKAIEIIDVGNVPLVSGLHTILARPNEGSFALGFSAYLFSSEGVRKQIQREAQGAKVLGLSARRLGNVQLHYPNNTDEQQEIADCLSSLDELIAAETHKLDALKTQKKGLMQQLFPCEGESVPRLRFPEFREAGAWQKRKVSDLLTRSVRPVDVDVEATYQEIGIRSHGKGVFHKELVSGKALGNKRVFWVEQDVFVANIVFAWEQAVAVTSAAENGMIASHRFPMYRAKKRKSDVSFIKYFFLTKKGKELLGIASPGGAGRNKTLGQKDFENLEFLAPEHVEEQFEIARCLSSLDDLITAQSEKIEVLKTHKKGLMQQLFLVMEKVQV